MLASVRSWIGRYPLRLATIALALYFLTGCVNRTQTETGAIQGSLNGQPVAIQWQRDSEGHTTVTVPPAVSVAAGFLPPPWGEIASLGLSLVAGGGIIAARSANRRAEEHKADAVEGWSRALGDKGEA